MRGFKTVYAVSLVLNFCLAFALARMHSKYEAEVEAHRQTLREEAEYLEGLKRQMKGNRESINKIMSGDKK